MKMCAADNCTNPVFGKGYCRNHQYMRSDFDRRTPSQKYQDKLRGGRIVKATIIPDDKVISSELDEVSRYDKGNGNAEMKRWFNERRLEMKGVCANCGKPSCKDDDKYFTFSIAHILPKAYFRSVAKHPLNWIELCFWGNSCHTNMDNKTLDLTEMNCWDTIVTRFQEMYPSIDKKERRRIPEVLLQYIEIDI